MTEHQRVLNIVRAKNSAPIKFTPETTALIVVDMQKYFTQPNHPLTDLFESFDEGIASGYLERVRTTVVPTIEKLLGAFRGNGSPVVFTSVGTEQGDGSDLCGWLGAFDEVGLDRLGTRIWPSVDDPSWARDERLEVKPHEPNFRKRSAGAFATTDLEKHLKDRGVDSVIVTGVSSDVCVATTARESADRSFRTVMVSDGCTTLSDEMHQASLDTFNVAFEMVLSADEVLGQFESN